MRIAICFHLGYLHRWEEFIPYIDNVIDYCPQTDIYISYRETEDPSTKCHKKYPNAHIMRAERGADTGAFLLQIKYIIQQKQSYDYVFKIHTKSNNIYCTTWINDLLSETAGNVQKISNMFQLFDDHPEIGMIGGKKWIVERKMSTDVNYPILNEICQRCGISLLGTQFVGGTIFWVRWSILKDVLSTINLEAEYNKCEVGKPSEPSATHSWERIYGMIINHANYRICGV
jgi:lipopolysaccharide biosynthesis protein